VTTDTIGPREIVRHEHNGLVVPVRDPVALADALERLLRDDALAERLRHNAYQEFLARHTRMDNLRQTLRVFEQLGSLRVDVPPPAGPTQPTSPPAAHPAVLAAGNRDAIGIYWPTQG
jgi:hypothetical protein